ncbi:hypothetical protein J3R82DRAFT_3035 [Butyriboletus roseoflavus]|nr:hypothetical protein J3R82DRAFT_3035 [Butyriboletus roseoflavus]
MTTKTSLVSTGKEQQDGTGEHSPAETQPPLRSDPRFRHVIFSHVFAFNFASNCNNCDIVMEEHALAILKLNDLWNWHDTKRIQASGNKFGGDVLNHFWKQFGTCDEKLKENIERLKEQDFVSAQTSFDVLFQGLDPKNVDFKPVLGMAAEFFTHLGIAFMNPGGRKSGTSTGYSVSEAVSEEMDKLVEQVNAKGEFGRRKQECLKALSFRRDGEICLLTGRKFAPFKKGGMLPALAHIIPNSVRGKPDTLKCIAMFAGGSARDIIVSHLNKIGNVMNMELNAHTTYDLLSWGIEAKEESGQVKYFFRMVPVDPDIDTLGIITLNEGDEIQFGKGLEGKKLNNGPIPILCNLQLAVARVLKMSGAADVILKWKDQADDDGCYGLFIASEGYFDMLDAKLFLSGAVGA